MNDKNINQKDDIQSNDKVNNKNLNNSIISSSNSNKKIIQINNKIPSKNNKKNKISSNENNISDIKSNGQTSPSQKSTSNILKTSKTLDKNFSYNSSKIVSPKKSKLQISSTITDTSDLNNKNSTSLKENKTLNSNTKKNMNKIMVNHKKSLNNSTNNAPNSMNAKNIKMNNMIKTKTNNSNDKKKNNKEKKELKEDNNIYNFITEECDENINKNNINSRKHYSLTNPSILPCIPFSNPFSYNNKNNNITENNEKNIRHIKSLNINNRYNKKNKENLENNYLENLDIMNAFKTNNESDKTEKDNEENVKLNISNLDIDIEDIDDDLDELNPKIELNSFPITTSHPNYKKSFIQFNNNLSLKIASEKTKNTPSYMLALCPKLFLGENKKKLIQENYAVNEPISEEIDSESITPRNSKYKYSLEEKTKYSTKDKNSDRNKKILDNDSEDLSYEEDFKKNTIFNDSSNTGRKSHNKNNYRTNKTKKIIKDNYNINNIDENKNTIMAKKRDYVRKKINVNDIKIETQNINNTNIFKESKNLNLKQNKDKNSPKNNISHCSYTTINNNNFNNEIDNNIVKIKTCKTVKTKNIERNENHQKAKSLLPDINLSSLYLYESIPNELNTINHSYSKKQNIKKINNKTNIKNTKNQLFTKKKSNENNKFNTNRNSYYKSNNDINAYHTCFSNTNINNNKKKKKKKELGQLVKSPKNKVNPFLSNFSDINEKQIYYNELNYTMNNNEFKYNDLLKKRNNENKFSNNNTITTMASNNNKSCNNLKKDINNMTHHKKVSQQFIDEFNFLLENKLENNTMINHTNTNNFNKNYKDQKLVRKEVLYTSNNNKSRIYNNKLNKDNNNYFKKSPLIIPCHKKSKTFFISPSYALKKTNNINSNKTKNYYKKINNNIKENKKEINKSNYSTTILIKNDNSKNNIKKKINLNSSDKKHNKTKRIFSTKLESDKKKVKFGKNKFNEIKNLIRENAFFKVIHKKTNTIGNTNDLSFLCQNLFNYNNYINSNNQSMFNTSTSCKNICDLNKPNNHKKSASINNLMNNLNNKKKIISAMQRIKFTPVSYYSKAIKEMTQINSNILVMLVYKDENQRFVFRGLYEANEKDPKNLYKVFAPNCEQGILNVNNINYFYNYSPNRGFFRYKFSDEKNKVFNGDTILIF